MKHKFITLEGIEGVGKSTQVKLLEETLSKLNIDFISTREPGGLASSEAIREIILHQEMSPITELLLYEAARSEHLEKIIRPALNNNKTVICDRFTDATIAYQGFGRGIDLDLIKNLNDIATDKLYPDITFIIDLPTEKSFERVISRGQKPDRFEKLKTEFFDNVRKGYLEQNRKEPQRVIIINGDQSVEKVHNDINSYLGLTEK